MPETLPRLRGALDILPSADANRPGFVLRDPLRYTDTILFLPILGVVLGCLDGAHTDLDAQELLTRLLGQLVLSADIRKLVGTLREQGFLETEEFAQLRDRKQAEFRAAERREAVHAGFGYPAAADDVRPFLERLLAETPVTAGPDSRAFGIAAPHVSIEGGASCYAAAYALLARRPELAGRTFVILGTSHYGLPDAFGLTRKPFATPLGVTPVDTRLVDWLGHHGGEAVQGEDYCHAVEHSVEFQCLFLQQVLGPDIRILPILCGPFGESLMTERPPESNARLACFFHALGEMAALEAGRLFWVLGIDLAHVGRRYGDPFDAVAGRGRMADLAEEDRRRIDLVCAGDASGFFEQLAADHDGLNWCGFSALYTFLKAVPHARGRLLRYDQWNIDPQSVVSFAGLEFFAAD